jgi:hypothetical protein
MIARRLGYRTVLLGAEVAIRDSPSVNRRRRWPAILIEQLADRNNLPRVRPAVARIGSLAAYVSRRRVRAEDAASRISTGARNAVSGECRSLESIARGARVRTTNVPIRIGCVRTSTEFLVHEAISAGVEYLDEGSKLESFDRAGSVPVLGGHSSRRSCPRFRTGLGGWTRSGPNGFHQPRAEYRQRGLSRELPRATQALFSHFTGVAPLVNRCRTSRGRGTHATPTAPSRARPRDRGSAPRGPEA